MKCFKSKEEAERYGSKNYFNPIVKETIHGNFRVKEGYVRQKKGEFSPVSGNQTKSPSTLSSKPPQRLIATILMGLIFFNKAK